MQTNIKPVKIIFLSPLSDSIWHSLFEEFHLRWDENCLQQADFVPKSL